jgi:hypothetical protein
VQNFYQDTPDGERRMRLAQRAAFNTMSDLATDIPEHLIMQYNCWTGVYTLLMAAQLGFAVAWYKRKE